MCSTRPDQQGFLFWLHQPGSAEDEGRSIHNRRELFERLAQKKAQRSGGLQGILPKDAMMSKIDMREAHGSLHNAPAFEKPPTAFFHSFDDRLPPQAKGPSSPAAVLPMAFFFHASLFLMLFHPNLPRVQTSVYQNQGKSARILVFWFGSVLVGGGNARPGTVMSPRVLACSARTIPEPYQKINRSRPETRTRRQCCDCL